ncbi:hypothetical protein VitviT2T_018942 [Vitis vinifera]|uniref:Integrase catalytic domain-containing protein n=1 Tax=Vitis vinifera TaxID=29760 RepID=A0ABY9D1F3_VITVI|nr:hypothetical protein VitviT2T_018942 [Vitis vinifera]
MIETQYNAKVRVLHSDNSREYQSSDLQKYLEEHGIIHQTTCSNTPQQNGVAERKNRHLLEVVRASLIAAKIPISYWGEAITSVAYLINQGEYHKEIQTLNYDYHIYEEDESGQSELVNQEAGELDMSGQQFGSEDVFTEIPNQSSSAEGVLNLEPDSFIKRLPHRHNRGKKPVGCRWIYTVKYKADGSIERFKARLVAKWYTQTYGIDYSETFAPVAKINTVRVLLSLVANLDWPLQEFDVKNAFLHGELSEEVYMDLPPGCMVSEKQCQKVCKLKKSLYGLKQSPRAWFGRFTKSMRAFGYRQSNSNHTLFLKKQHVDDRRSTSGYFTFVGGNLMTWKNKKQNVVARSSAEAEFRGMTLGLCEALWLRLLLQDLGYLSRQPIRLFCDNKVACDIAHNPVQHDHTNHVEVDRFFIKEKLDDKIVELPKIRSKDQLVDILTKVAVSSRVFSKFLDKLGMCDIYAPT